MFLIYHNPAHTNCNHRLYTTPNSRGTKVAYRAKTHFFAPERYAAEILYTDGLNST